MKKKIYLALICTLGLAVFAGCGSSSAEDKSEQTVSVEENVSEEIEDADETDTNEADTNEADKNEEKTNDSEETKPEEDETIVPDEVTDDDENIAPDEATMDEAMVASIANYCVTVNPDLKDIVDAGEYTVYWEIYSSDENELVVVYRSYTGALNYFYIDRNTGDTYVTEFVPGITDEEEPTGESFNVRDY